MPPAPAFTVCTRSWALGGLPAQPVPGRVTNIDAVSSGGYTRRPRTLAGLQAFGSNTPTSVMVTTADAVWPGPRVTGPPIEPARWAGAPTCVPLSPVT